MRRRCISAGAAKECCAHAIISPTARRVLQYQYSRRCRCRRIAHRIFSSRRGRGVLAASSAARESLSPCWAANSMERAQDARRPDEVRRDDDNQVPTRDCAREAKRDALMIEIAGRLRPVCRHLPDDEFTQLVSDIADTRLRFAAIDARAWPRRDGDDGTTPDPPAAPADM